VANLKRSLPAPGPLGVASGSGMGRVRVGAFHPGRRRAVSGSRSTCPKRRFNGRAAQCTSVGKSPFKMESHGPREGPPTKLKCKLYKLACCSGPCSDEGLRGVEAHCAAIERCAWRARGCVWHFDRRQHTHASGPLLPPMAACESPLEVTRANRFGISVRLITYIGRQVQVSWGRRKN
jgi:hypothetical protein